MREERIRQVPTGQLGVTKALERAKDNVMLYSCFTAHAHFTMLWRSLIQLYINAFRNTLEFLFQCMFSFETIIINT